MAQDAVQKIDPQLPAVQTKPPDYMAEDGKLGTEELAAQVVVPRIKIIQKQASTELLAEFGVGDVIVAPLNQPVCECPRGDRGQPSVNSYRAFTFTPLFYYTEWCTWNDIRMRGSLPAIAYRTMDPNDPIVVKSRSASLREESDPENGDNVLRHVEHLTYIILIHGHQTLGAQPVALSFQRAEHFHGRKFATLTRLRAAPLFGCNYVASVAHRAGTGKGDWWGIDVANDSERPWVSKDDYQKMKELYETFKGLHESSSLKASYDDPAEDEPPDSGEF